MKKILLIISLLVSTHCLILAQQNHFTLKGFTNNIPENTMVYLTDGATSQRIDSVTIKNNQFVFTGDAAPYKEYWVLSLIHI